MDAREVSAEDIERYISDTFRSACQYAGINVEHPGLFAGIRGSQLAGRCVPIRTGPFPLNAKWRSLVASLEGTLRLHQHEPGALVRLSKYFYQRTGGMIGSLSHLIRAAAVTAILDGSERVTRSVLTTIRIDHSSESTQSGQSTPRRSAG